MQLTEELTHVARRLPGEVRPDGRGARVQRPVLPARLRVGPVRGRRGRADARDRRDAPPDRRREPLPVARRDAPPPADPARRRAGRGSRRSNDDAIVHHDAVVWAHLEHLAGTTRPGRAEHHGPGDRPRRRRRGGGRHRPRPDRDAGRPQRAGGWSTELNALAGVSAPNRPLRREVLVTAPLRRTIEAAVTFYRPTEGWFNQTLRGEIVMGVVDPDEPAGVNQASSWDFLRRTATLMTRKAPALADVAVIRQWGGMYDVRPDHQPLVGPTPSSTAGGRRTAGAAGGCCSRRT